MYKTMLCAALIAIVCFAGSCGTTTTQTSSIERPARDILVTNACTNGNKIVFTFQETAELLTIQNKSTGALQEELPYNRNTDQTIIITTESGAEFSALEKHGHYIFTALPHENTVLLCAGLYVPPIKSTSIEGTYNIIEMVYGTTTNAVTDLNYGIAGFNAGNFNYATGNISGIPGLGSPQTDTYSYTPGTISFTTNTEDYGLLNSKTIAINRPVLGKMLAGTKQPSTYYSLNWPALAGKYFSIITSTGKHGLIKFNSALASITITLAGTSNTYTFTEWQPGLFGYNDGSLYMLLTVANDEIIAGTQYDSSDNSFIHFIGF